MFGTFSFQVDQSGSTTNLISQKSSNLVEQVFNSSLFRNKDSSLTGGLSSGKIMDPRLSETRGRPIWTVDDRESRITPLDLQVKLVDFEVTVFVKIILLFPVFSLKQSWCQWQYNLKTD